MSLRHHIVIDHRHRRTAVVVLCIVTLAVWALIGFLIWSGYLAEIRAAEVNTRNNAAMIDARLDATLRRADATMKELAAELPVNALSRRAAPQFAHKIHAELKTQLTDFPEVDSIRIVDAEGEAIYDSNSLKPAPLNIADRAHFRRVKENPQAGLVFSETLVSRVTGRTGIFAIRAIRDAQGAFRGAITASVNLEFFRALFKALDIGAHGAIGLRRSDNQTLVLRQPPIEALINQPLKSHNATVAALASGQRATTQRLRAESDGVMRIYSSHALEQFPFYIGVALSYDEVLTAWRVRSLIVGLCGLLLTALLAGMMIRLWHVEDSLIEKEQLMRGTFEQAAVGIAHIDPRTLRILIANDRYCSLTGYTQNELNTAGARLLIPPGDAASRDAERARVLAGEIKTASSERRILRKDGGLLWVHRSLSLVRDDSGTPLYFISVIEDISGRKQVEAELEDLNSDLEVRITERTAELESANRELSAFSYTVAHDLRAPVRAINGYSSMVLNASADRLDATSADYLKRVVTASIRMGNLIDALLGLAHLSRQTMVPAEFSLSDMAASIAAALKDAHPARSVLVRIQANMQAHGDAGLIRAALENLIGNAWKFTGKADAAKIDIGSEQREGQTVYHVRDNGAGFDMKYAHKLFEPFQRLHHVSEFDGTGIGLATVKKIIQRHNGKIWIESAVNNGTTVHFTIGAAA